MCYVFIIQSLFLLITITNFVYTSSLQLSDFDNNDGFHVLPEDILAENMKIEIAKKVRPDYAPNKQMILNTGRKISSKFAIAKAMHLKQERFIPRHRHRRNHDSTVISKYLRDSDEQPDMGEHLTITSRPCPYCADNENRIWFNIEELTSYTFEDATLLIDIGKIRAKHPENEYRLQLFVYVSDDKIIEYRHLKKAHDFDNFTNPLESTKKWEEIIITPIVRKWHKNLPSNFGVRVKVAVYNNNNFIETISFNVSNPRSYLELSNTKRVKRNFVYQKRKRTPVCAHNATSGSMGKHQTDSCCLLPYTINFNDFKWDFIIAPKQVEMYYCAGFCDFSTLRKVHHSEILYMNDLELCCSADIADPLEIIYVDEEYNVHMKYLPNMIVRSCACG